MYIDEELYPYHIVLTDENHTIRKEMYIWCQEQWGNPQNLNKESHWIFTTTEKGNVLKFKNEADRTLFLLRWG